MPSGDRWQHKMHLRRDWGSLDCLPTVSNAERRLRDAAIRQLATQSFNASHHNSNNNNNSIGASRSGASDHLLLDSPSAELRSPSRGAPVAQSRPFSPAASWTGSASDMRSPLHFLRPPKEVTSHQDWSSVEEGPRCSSQSSHVARFHSSGGYSASLRNAVIPPPRPLLIANVKESGYAGIDEGCCMVGGRAATPFGTGTRGLCVTSPSSRQSAAALQKDAVEEWSKAKDRWMFDDRQREAERRKALVARTAGVDHHKHFAVGMRQVAELSALRKHEDSQAAKKAWESERDAAQAYVGVLREAETANVVAIRQAALKAESERHAKEKEMLVAGQRLAEMERLTRQLALLERDAVAGAKEASRRQNIQERRREASESKRDVAAARSSERLSTASKTRKEEKQRKKLAEGFQSCRLEDNRNMVRQVQKSLKEGREMAEALQERRMGRRHEAILKERQELESRIAERAKAEVEARREKSQAIRDEETSHRRRRRDLAAFGEKGDDWTDDDDDVRSV